ncbi:hypothetical protein Leryth_008903 [Lithospermum erythrorhizon]|nr:hypothetical protein Leryth_008903 [Lithospermum erythrorhizon]
MDLTNSDVVSETPIGLCNCYKASDLVQTILDSTETADFKDRYALGHQLGWGKFGIIRACTDKLTGELLACKSIAKERLVTTDDVRSVKLEIDIMTRLSGHLNVVDLKAVYEDNDYVHIVMELCAGGELFHQIEKHGRFSEFDAKILFRQLMEVVVFCHDKGFVHRDLKPENILLVSRSSSSPIKLADFGLATYIKPGQKLNVTVGSPFYIAPEVLSGGYNQAADIWSAGVILYILLSGMPPFWGKTKSEIFDAVRGAKLRFHPHLWDHISASAKDLITKMICVDPSKRFTATEVLGHTWMKHSAEEVHSHSGQRSPSSQCMEEGNGSDSAPFMSRDEDYSFAEGPPAIADEKGDVSPVFTCRSSFSSFLVDHTPCSLSDGFSFGSSCEPSALDFSSPLPSMPSFTFFSPGPGSAHGDECSSLKDEKLSINEESSSGQMFELPEPPHQLVERRFREMDYTAEFLRGGGNSSAFKITSMSSKRRNYTIGAGELDQLDLLATESFIRWASCTHISSASSLRSSLPNRWHDMPRHASSSQFSTL